MRQISPIVACNLADAGTINPPLAAAFDRLDEHDFKHRSHLIDGRFENLYLEREQLPGLDVILDFAVLRARALLGSARASWLESPLDPDQPLRVGFWANAMLPGQSTSRHRHEENDELCSGVYYVTAPAHSGDIVFHDSPFEIRVTPRDGLMLLFSPALDHSVEVNRSSVQRLSIAFNIGPET
jgi:hypothetical protein